VSYPDPHESSGEIRGVLADGNVMALVVGEYVRLVRADEGAKEVTFAFGEHG